MSTYPPRHGTDPQSLAHWAVACVASARVLRAEGHPGQAADLEHAATLAATPPPGHPTTTPRAPRTFTMPATPTQTTTSDDAAPWAGASEDAVAEVPSWWR